MNESNWLTSTNVFKMLAQLDRNVSPRKSRLLAVAACRRVWHLMRDRRTRRAVDAAEEFADEAIWKKDLRAASLQIGRLNRTRFAEAENSSDPSVWIPLRVSGAA